MGCGASSAATAPTRAEEQINAPSPTQALRQVKHQSDDAPCPAAQTRLADDRALAEAAACAAAEQLVTAAVNEHERIAPEVATERSDYVFQRALSADARKFESCTLSDATAMADALELQVKRIEADVLGHVQHHEVAREDDADNKEEEQSGTLKHEKSELKGRAKNSKTKSEHKIAKKKHFADGDETIADAGDADPERKLKKTSLVENAGVGDDRDHEAETKKKKKKKEKKEKKKKEKQENQDNGNDRENADGTYTSSTHEGKKKRKKSEKHKTKQEQASSDSE
ncbi:MAG: hypothetical protein SGPRY_001678 [Prymnesium sp.]